jgi:hypothetical protein
VASADCDVAVRDFVGGPLPGGQARSVSVVALPHDLKRGGSVTVTARARVMGNDEAATTTVAVHPITYTYETEIGGTPTMYAEARRNELKVGGHIGVDQRNWFSVVGTVRLTNPCPRDGCAATHLRLGWAQSIARASRIEYYGNTRVEHRLPGQLPAQGNAIEPPVRDGAGPHHFFVDDAASVAFLANAARARLRDYPGLTVPWSMGQIGDLDSVLHDEKFLAWLVVRHDWWWQHINPVQSARYVAHLTWDVHIKVKVANAPARQLVANTDVGIIQWTQPQEGRGAVAATFTGQVANNVQTIRFVVTDGRGNVLYEV